MNYSSCRSGFLEVSHFSKKISVFGNLKTVWFWCFQIVQNICICIHMLFNKSRNVYIASSCIDLCKCINYCDTMSILILLLLLCFDCLLLPGICICIMNHWQHIWNHTRYQFNMFCPDLKIEASKKIVNCCLCCSVLLFVFGCWCIVHTSIHISTHQHTHQHTSLHINQYTSEPISTHQHTYHCTYKCTYEHTHQCTQQHTSLHISVHISIHTPIHISIHTAVHI